MSPEEIQAAQIQALHENIGYLRGLLKKHSRDFVDFRLEEIAKETEMTDSIKAIVIHALDNPDLEIKINFKPKT